MLPFAWLSPLAHFQSPQILKVDLWKSSTQIILSYKFSSLNNPLKIPISNFKNFTIYVHLFNYCFHYYYYYYYYYSTYLFIYLLLLLLSFYLFIFKKFHIQIISNISIFYNLTFIVSTS